jgi:hypothetical protein
MQVACRMPRIGKTRRERGPIIKTPLRILIPALALAWLVTGCTPATDAPSAPETATAGDPAATAAARAAPASVTPSPTSTALPPTSTPIPIPSPPPSPSPSATTSAAPTARPTVQPTALSTSEPITRLVDRTLTPTSALSSSLDLPSPTPSPSGRVAVWEGTITLDAYGWHEALVPTQSDDPIYPYPRLDFEAVTGPVPRTYRAIFLQNRYVELVVVPELGGRILRWTDRVTGRRLTYANPVVKPSQWGYRGWWLATGGIEWAFPVEEHGLNEYRPWQHQLMWNGVRVWDVDDRTGMLVEVTILIDSQHAYFTLMPRITNPTGESQRYQFWANAMLTLSDWNAPSQELVFVLPDDAVTVHATGDATLPGTGRPMRWPVHDGRDFSHFAEWRQYLGVFADPAAAGFVGAYDERSDQGIVRVFPHTTATGVKLFCLGDLSSEMWTDDGGRYFELWGGLTPTFWDYWTLEPDASVTWTERWYPVSGIGGFNWANDEAVIRLVPSGDRAEVAVATSRAIDGTVVLRQNGTEVQRWGASLSPGQSFHADGGPSAGSGDWGVQVLEGGVVVAQMGP